MICLIWLNFVGRTDFKCIDQSKCETKGNLWGSGIPLIFRPFNGMDNNFFTLFASITVLGEWPIPKIHKFSNHLPKTKKTRLHFCHLVDGSCFCWFSLDLIRYRKEFNLLLVAGVKWEKVRYCAVVYKSIPNQITNHSDKFIHILLDFNAWNSLGVELSILGKALTQFLKDYTQYAIASVYLMAITLNITITFIRLNQIQTLLCDWVYALPPLLLSLALFRSLSLSLVHSRHIQRHYITS